jgi:glyceraldehyde-3-phosphate dehydrogenase (NADP+)
MILRPSSQTPITALKLGEICMEAGLPPGALNVIPCSTTLVEKLLTDDRVKKVSFTGSAEIGWGIKEKAYKKKVTLELGGNAAVIIDKDADIEFSARRTAIGGFAYAGQVCIAVQRIYVHKDIYDHFYKAFEKVVKNEIVTGDPMKEETVVGPIIEDSAADRIMEWVQEAKQNGAKALIDGKRNGRMIEPIVLTDVSPSMKVSCKEIFGPVVTIESYEHFSDAIARVNNSVYGLQCGVFTKNLDYVLKAFNEIEVGGVIINDYPTFRVDNMPYGGVKESGFGREGVRYAIEEMTELKLLVLNFH